MWVKSRFWPPYDRDRAVLLIGPDPALAADVDGPVLAAAAEAGQRDRKSVV